MAVNPYNETQACRLHTKKKPWRESKDYKVKQLQEGQQRRSHTRMMPTLLQSQLAAKALTTHIHACETTKINGTIVKYTI